MGNKTNCIIIHGCPPKEDQFLPIERGNYNEKHWIKWVKNQLILQGVKTENPLMPNPWAPIYEDFKKEFEKYPVDENTILVGHSCGCAFLVRWLGESKQKIKKLILVAPWKIPNLNDGFREKFYEYEIDKSINEQVKEIVMFTSDTESEGGKKSLEIYKQSLKGKIIELKGKGHFKYQDMGTEEFPELLKEILVS